MWSSARDVLRGVLDRRTVAGDDSLRQRLAFLVEGELGKEMLAAQFAFALIEALHVDIARRLQFPQRIILRHVRVEEESKVLRLHVEAILIDHNIAPEVRRFEAAGPVRSLRRVFSGGGRLDIVEEAQFDALRPPDIEFRQRRVRPRFIRTGILIQPRRRIVAGRRIARILETVRHRRALQAHVAGPEELAPPRRPRLSPRRLRRAEFILKTIAAGREFRVLDQERMVGRAAQGNAVER